MSLRRILVVNNNSPGFQNIITILNKYELAKIVEVRQSDLPEYDLDELSMDCYAIILSGGFEHVDPTLMGVRKEKMLLDLAFQNHIPVLGICYGFQLLSYFYGGRKLEKLGCLLRDSVAVKILKDDALFHGISNLIVNQDHEEYVKFEDEQFGHFNVLAVSQYKDKDVVEVIKSKSGLMYGVQFHPEKLSESVNGHKIIFNFLDMFL